MDTFAFDQIPFRIDMDSLKEKLHLKEGSSYFERLMLLVEEAQRIGRPKGAYKLAFIDSKGDDFVIVNGVRFKSRVLRVNLEQALRVFPYLATCGVELEEWANGIEDVLERYWAETIKEMALRVAASVIEKDLMERFRPGNVSRMSPGSLSDWPIEEQRPLFRLLGDTKESLGVYLTESLLMIPTKSISGIRFPTEVNFESCQLCPRELCPNRRAPYDKDLLDTKYHP